jgi:tryptophan synthase alpha chain
MNPIDALFRRLRSDKRKAFIPFLTAGDPDFKATELAVRELVARGASLVEIGFPYTDPIADGPVIQASYTRSLDRGVRTDDVLSWAAGMTQTAEWSRSGVPMVAMVSYSLVHHRGPELFVFQAQAAGFSGAIVPDLPIEEAPLLAHAAGERDFKLIQLATPTTSRDRALRIMELATGFLYCVSVTGITGEREQLPAELLEQLRWLREQTSLPLCVGFGISRPDQVRMLRDAVDGVIVGSALVRLFEQAGHKTVEQIVSEIGSLAKSLADALNPEASDLSK